jgi:hypothetical protein
MRDWLSGTISSPVGWFFVAGFLLPALIPDIAAAAHLCGFVKRYGVFGG